MEWGLRHISSRELSEWMAFFRLDGPQGAQRADWHAGMIAATMANIHRNPKARKRPYTPEDFMPKPPLSEEERQEILMRKVELLNRVFGGRDLRRKDGDHQ